MRRRSPIGHALPVGLPRIGTPNCRKPAYPKNGFPFPPELSLGGFFFQGRALFRSSPITRGKINLR